MSWLFNLTPQQEKRFKRLQLLRTSSDAALWEVLTVRQKIRYYLFNSLACVIIISLGVWGFYEWIQQFKK